MTRRRAARTIPVAVLAALGLAVLAGPGASAHALVGSSDPAAGATLTTSPSQIVITFTEQPDLKRSLIQVLDTSGKILAGGPPQAVPGQPPTVTRVPVTTVLPKGVYTVSWKSISVVDGHLATGAFAFGIGEAPSGSATVASVKSPGPSEVASVSRSFYLAGLIGLLGLAFTELVVLAGRPSPRRLGPAMAASWAAGVAGLLGMTSAQASGASLGVGALLSSSIGHAFLLRAVPLVVAGAALFLRRRLPGPGTGLLGVAAMGAMLADVLKSHAAASPSWLWVKIGTQWVHFLAVGIWIGGLGGLVLCLSPLGPGNRGPATRRFSFWAAVSLALVGVTGTVRAFDEVGGWHPLFHTGFGQLIVLKVALFGGLAMFGAVNRYRNVAKVEARPRGLRRTATAELAVMAVVLAATGLLQNLAPSRLTTPSASAALAPIELDAHDFATLYRVHLTITPGAAGFNTFAAQVEDYVTRKVQRVDGVSVSFHYTDSASVGDSTLALARQPGGSYVGQGANLGLVGHWQLTTLVSNGASSVDVPMEMVTQTRAEQTTAQAFKGSPTVYTVQLGGGKTVQIYIQPPSFGKSEFHATFFDAQSQELPMSTFTVMQSRAPGGAATLLAFHKLSAGHFVADASGTKGTYSFSIAGLSGAGDALGATIRLQVT